LKVSEVMQTEFSSLRADQTLAEVIRAFAKHKITSAPVFTGSKFVGMISDADIAKYLIDAANAAIQKSEAKPKAGAAAKERKAPVGKVRNVTAGALARMPKVVLSPGNSIFCALPEIARRIDCIPVVDAGKFAGVVRGDDITRFFLRELAKEDLAKAGGENGGQPMSGQPGNRIDTDMDRILEIIKQDGETSSAKIAAELGVTVQAAEQLCESLANHHLVEMNYSFMKGTTVRGTTSEKE